MHSHLLRFALSICLFVPSAVCLSQTEVINEDFDGVVGLPPGVSSVCAGGACGAGLPQAQGDGCDNDVLLLTDGQNNEGSWVWFPDQFDLNNERVEIEFDLFIGAATSAVPADGISVIFQFDGDLTAVGDAGGGIGVGNLRSQGGTAYEYVAVSFDIWDNGGVDIETPVDGRYGAQSTAHVEVNQNIDPENVASQATGPSPDYIASAGIYNDQILIPPVTGSCDPGDLIHVEIVFDNRLMLVTMSGPAGPDDPAVPFPETIVMNYATAPFPNALSNIGFTASTGAANAVQWIDNLVVREAPSAVTFEPEPLLTEAGMNCNGPAVDATAEIGQAFRAQGQFEGELSRVGDIATGLTITTSRIGRVPTGADNNSVNPRPIDVSDIAGAGPLTASLFGTTAWSTIGVNYAAEVEPGRYDVTLFFHEDFAPAINGLGQNTKIFDVAIGDEKVLCFWAPGAAAGSATGSGDPSQTCTAVLDKGVARTFSVDVVDSGDGTGLLNVLVDDLGAGNPPENAVLNALHFSRTGAVTGAPASGDIECIAPPAAADPSGILIENDFEDGDENFCPDGMVCNASVGFVPVTVVDTVAGDQRLRVIADTTGTTGATAIFEQTVNVNGYKLFAEFDVFMGNPDAAAPADGGGFFVLEGNNTAAVGAAGGAMGIPGGVGFAVEFDTWDNGGGENDPSGYNTANTWVHVGINPMSINHIITNVQYDPDLIPVSFGGTGWPDFFHPDGVHVEVSYDAGHISVSLTGTEEDGVTPFGPTVVAETTIYPLQSSEAVVGFFGGTGGATQDLDFDNVVIEAEEGDPDAGSGAEFIAQAAALWNDGAGALYINSGGPMLACSGSANPAPGATEDADTGDSVVWLGDLVGGGSLNPALNDLFAVVPLFNLDGSNSGLQVANTDMGVWDARGTEAGIDDNDRIFHTERWADAQYEIPVINGDDYEVTLYFANSFSGTSGTARRFFHVEVEGAQLTDFDHCEFAGRGILGNTPNPLFGFDNLYDPVGAAEMLYSPDPCNFATCANNGVTVQNDPEPDQILAPEECGNAAAAAIRFETSVSDGVLTIAITEPDTLSGEPASPDMNPKISGLSVRNLNVGPVGVPFVRGDANNDRVANISDAQYILNFLFLGGPGLACSIAGDANSDGATNISDAQFILNFLFLGGPGISAPNACGEQPFATREQCAASACEGA